ncbi:hypothetical protein PC116_g12769 [Phytophthora cactorum]|uniref:Uncharacterized protein n=1 Tax=Phytophthora cactorum TaxID=29920 RepID=A0A8T1KUC0_9STRA|nr:hypothetical protein PC114_g9416 [Phytophthora cactorum]KAG2930108.1 hypothetical protein PC117_g13808 [Phytophthora cactorum]KAG3010017.1 hypothetical protein PC119_g13715 [Phytophthora cactorum]KAG3193555.1 hypothetical protein PC128_g10132 [Phytophthora cactorum]KAG4052301.1 hypothetical protein PC123_g12513 [Phytophthora cactorum]
MPDVLSPTSRDVRFKSEAASRREDALARAGAKLKFPSPPAVVDQSSQAKTEARQGKSEDLINRRGENALHTSK